MPLQSPDFWKKPNLTAKALLPAAALYQLGYRMRRQHTKPVALNAKILCIGNLIAGGAGKTPVALAMGEYLKTQGVQACFLSKGYGGSLCAPTRVDFHQHTARQVGDEPLLLAQVLPTIVAKNRAEGAAFAQQHGFSLIILDDGFQNPTIKPDFSVIVADAAYGFGNGYTLPAGPLREPVAYGLSRADALVVLRRDRKQQTQITDYAIPTLTADLRTSCPTELTGKKLVAFSGIARPQQFFEALVQHCGAYVIASHAFADHHPFSAAELEQLQHEAQKHDATLITTAKDAVRLPASLRSQVMVAQATINWHNADALTSLLAPLLSQMET
jgi:tetraacyldisaccharide 4'-kinase